MLKELWSIVSVSWCAECLRGRRGRRFAGGLASWSVIALPVNSPRPQGSFDGALTQKRWLRRVMHYQEVLLVLWHVMK